MKKAFIAIPILIVVAAAAVLGLFAAGIIGNKAGDAPVAQAITETVSESGYFGELPVETYFDIITDRDPSTAMDNYVVIRNNRGEKVALKSDRQPDGTYRITAREGFKPRATYKIFVYAAEFASEKYAGLTSFIFTIDGEEVEKIHIKDDVDQTKREVESVKLEKVGDEYFYIVTLAAAAEKRFQKGDVILAKKPAEEDVDPDLANLYERDIEGYEYNGLAAYTVERESVVKDGREELYCRLSKLDEVLDELDIYKHVQLDENNFWVDEEEIIHALENCEFYKAVEEAAEETYDEIIADLKEIKGGLPSVTVREKPKVTCGVSWVLGMEKGKAAKVGLTCTFSISFAQNVTIIVALENVIYLDPIFHASCSFGLSEGVDLELNAGLNVRTETTISIKMDMHDINDIPKSFESFKNNLEKKETSWISDPVKGEIPFFHWDMPIWIFVLEFEIGMEMNFDIRAELGFEYKYVTETTFGVSFVNGSFDFYKTFKADNTASDLVLLGHVREEAGVYIQFSVSCLKIVGVGIRVGAGVYGNLDGQIRMQWLTDDSDGNFIIGYYVTLGAYVDMKFRLKAGFSAPLIGFVGYKKDFTIKKWEFPLFEFGSPYMIRSAEDQRIEIRGPNATVSDISCSAYDLRTLKDELGMPISPKEFNFEYIDDAADYIIYKPEDSLVLVRSSVGDEFEKKVRLKAKSNKTATCVLTFHKDAVMPTCEEPELKYDVKDGGNLTFKVKLNQSEFIGLSGDNISFANYKVDENVGDITIYDSYLATLSLGEHIFVYSTNKGSIYLTIIVKNSTPITAEKTSATFNKSARANLAFKLKLSGNYVKSVSDLDPRFFSVDKSGTMVIYALGLMDKDVGETTLTVTASNDTTLDLKVLIEDDRVPVIYQDTYPFGKNVAVRNDVAVAFEKYGYSVNEVSGNGISASDYSVEKDKVILKATYLSGLNVGEHSFKIKFASSKTTVEKEFLVRVSENAALLAYTTVASFDKADPKDAKFTIVSTDNYTLSGNGIAVANYSVKDNELTIKASFLSTLSVGENAFTVASKSDNVKIIVEVENNVVPQIVESEELSVKDGKLSLSYDKSKKGSLSFELILGGNPIKQVISDAAPDLSYITETTAKDTTKFLISEEYLQSIKCGTYEYRVVTDVLNLIFTLSVTNNGMPTPVSQTSLSYMKGSNATMQVAFVSNDKDVKKIECSGSGLKENAKASSISLGEQFTWDPNTEILTFLNGEYCYAEQLAAGYYKLTVYFGDKKDNDEKNWIPVNIGITVSDKQAGWLPDWETE